MTDWLQAPDEEEDGASGVAAALADPRGTFGDENGAVPETVPTIREGAPSEDANADADREASEMAGAAPTEVPYKPADDSGLPPDESMLSSEFQPANNRVESPAPIESNGDSGDIEAAQLAGGTPTFVAPAPLKYTPYEDHSADQQALVAQKASESPDAYKPSGWRRVLAGAAGALTAAGSGSASEGRAQVKDIEGRPLAAAQKQWTAQDATLQQQIEADKAADAAVNRQNVQETNRYNADERNVTNQARVANWNAQAQQRRDMAQAKLNTVDRNTLGPVDPTKPFGEWQGKTPGGKIVRGLDPPASIQKDPRFISAQRRQQISDMATAGVKLTPQETKYFLANGKLAEPSEHTSINIREKPDGSWAGNGSGSPTDPDNIIAKNMQDKQNFADSWKRVDQDQDIKDAEGNILATIPAGSYTDTATGTKSMSGKEFDDRIAKFRTDMNANPNMRKAGVMVDEKGNTVKVGPQTAATGNRPAATAQTQPAPQPAKILPHPSQAQFNVGKWKAANPKGDANAAIAAAKAKNYAIVGQ